VTGRLEASRGQPPSRTEIRVFYASAILADDNARRQTRERFSRVPA
jgi:hypothetical protein